MSGIVLPSPGKMSAEEAEGLLSGAQLLVGSRTAEQLRNRLVRDGWKDAAARCLASAPEALRTVGALTAALTVAREEVDGLRARIRNMNGDLDRAEVVVVLDRAGAPAKGPNGDPLSLAERIRTMSAMIHAFEEHHRSLGAPVADDVVGEAMGCP